MTKRGGVSYFGEDFILISYLIVYNKNVLNETNTMHIP